MANTFLDSNLIKFGWRKVLSLLPVLGTYAIISYISYQFLWNYVPEKKFKDNLHSPQAILCRILFGYFSAMTFAFLTMTYLKNPGYLPKWLKAPVALDPVGEPLKLVRVYNLRMWVANGIHSFDELVQPLSQSAEQEEES